jgi:hypothetical protein
MRSIDPCPKCGGEKTHKGRRPTAFFRSPRSEATKRKPYVEAVELVKKAVLLPIKIIISLKTIDKIQFL